MRTYTPRWGATDIPSTAPLLLVVVRIGTAALDHPPGRRCSVRGRRRQGQLTGLSQRVQVKYGTIVLPVVDRHRHVGAARERLLDRALKLRMDGVMQVVQEEYGSVKRRMRGGIHDGSVGSL